MTTTTAQAETPHDPITCPCCHGDGRVIPTPDLVRDMMENPSLGQVAKHAVERLEDPDLRKLLSNSKGILYRAAATELETRADAPDPKQVRALVPCPGPPEGCGSDTEKICRTETGTHANYVHNARVKAYMDHLATVQEEIQAGDDALAEHLARLLIDCPYCNQDMKNGCKTMKGNPRDTVHEARKDALMDHIAEASR